MASCDAFAGDSQKWLESHQWVARARRLGPLRYSDLGPRRLGPPASGEGELRALASWIAAAADGWWEAAGRPDPYTLVVASGDDGHLARAVLAAGPACSRALRYVLVDPDQAGRREPPPGMAALLALEEPAFLYPASAGQETPPSQGDGGEELDLEFGEHLPARGIGPLATFLADVPALGEEDGAIVAVRLLSRLPYDLYERRDGEWCEVRIAAGARDPSGAPDSHAAPAPSAADPHAGTHSPVSIELVELTVPARDLPLTPPGGPDKETPRWRSLTGATDWLRRVLPTAAAGVLAVIDEWAPPGDTETLDLAQLRQVREPQTAQPTAIGGTPLSVVTWRLG